MAVHSPDASADASTDPAASLGSLIVDDLRRTRFRRRDMRALYEFYVDEERRAQVAAMGRLRGWVYITAFLLRSLYLKLPRERRSLLLIALVFAVLSSVELTYGSLEIRQDLRLPAFVLLLFILMLELRDKVLARDELAVGREVQLALLPREAPRCRAGRSGSTPARRTTSAATWSTRCRSTVAGPASRWATSPARGWAPRC